MYIMAEQQFCMFHLHCVEAALATLSLEFGGRQFPIEVQSLQKHAPQPSLSLALDGIADVSPGSGFSQTLTPKQQKEANAIAIPDIHEKWPALIIQRCGPSVEERGP
ncbi:hypothetical protein BGZ94_004544 [Podila epigama]|nr:hypothetical protein BGZ94_004544 [Podila epigama]